jgi:hypothetical protein
MVYLRCDPRTYEEFDVEQHILLPQCPEELTGGVKIGQAYNLAN